MAARGVRWFCGTRSFLDFLGYRSARWGMLAGDAANGEAVEFTVGLGRVEIATAKVEFVHVVTTASGTRPIAASGADIIERAVIDIDLAGSRPSCTVNY